jgi:hypothetical protein
LVKQEAKEVGKEGLEKLAKEESERLAKEEATQATKQVDEIAPNGVKNITKREWTEGEYKQWFDNLPKESARTNTDADIYQIIHAGEKERVVSGSGVKFKADGIADKNILEAKFVGNSARSPYIENSKFPAFLREVTDKKTRSEFERMSKILQDGKNPLTKVRVITNDEKAVPYFQKLMREYNVPGEVILRKEKDIIYK